MWKMIWEVVRPLKCELITTPSLQALLYVKIGS